MTNIAFKAKFFFIGSFIFFTAIYLILLSSNNTNEALILMKNVAITGHIASGIATLSLLPHIVKYKFKTKP